ncbi:MAG: HupE/UreJ family protein [Bacteroidia bacterium]
MKGSLSLVLLCLALLLFTFSSCGVKGGTSGSSIFIIYLELGFTHIFPFGFDHVLFILSLFLLSPKLKPVIWQATAFTVAHSITLGLAVFGLISIPAYIIEPIIALSIVYVSLENLVTEKLKPARVFIIFIFGLLHGLGFAGVLKDLVSKNELLSSLVSFNLGVELGQITVILAAWLLFGRWFSKKNWYRKFIVIPMSILIALIALYWTIERIFFN